MVQTASATSFRLVLGVPALLERDFCAHVALVCLSSPSRRLLTSPLYRISGTPHAARHRLRRRLRPRPHPGHHRRRRRHRRRPLRRRDSVFPANLRRSKLCVVRCMRAVWCGFRPPGALWATPGRVRAAQARSGGGLRACWGRRERQRRPGRAAARVRSVALCVRPISGKKGDVYEIISWVYGV